MRKFLNRSQEEDLQLSSFLQQYKKRICKKPKSGKFMLKKEVFWYHFYPHLLKLTFMITTIS